jgi:hypothetical protein
MDPFASESVHAGLEERVQELRNAGEGEGGAGSHGMESFTSRFSRSVTYDSRLPRDSKIFPSANRNASRVE